MRTTARVGPRLLVPAGAVGASAAASDSSGNVRNASDEHVAGAPAAATADGEGTVVPGKLADAGQLLSANDCNCWMASAMLSELRLISNF